MNPNLQSYRVSLNYTTASGGNTYRTTVRAHDEDSAIDAAMIELRKARGVHVLKIDGGDVETVAT